MFSIGIWQSNGIPITNNVVYNATESGIVVIGKNNLLDGNLVTTVYWSGQAQPAYAEFNTNYDGAIMSRYAESVIMRVSVFDRVTQCTCMYISFRITWLLVFNELLIVFKEIHVLEQFYLQI